MQIRWTYHIYQYNQKGIHYAKENVLIGNRRKNKVVVVSPANKIMKLGIV